MSTTRSIRGVARGVLRVPPTRSLSATAPFSARPRPRPAPKKSRDLPPMPDGHLELQLPPVTLLKSARKSGALDIEPERALSILRDYAEIYNQRKPGTWEKQFCAEENITPSTLTLLSLILTKTKEEPCQVMGTTLLFTASALGEPSATILLINSALRNKWLEYHEYTAPFAHLRKLAAPPYSNIEAMILLGKVYESQGDKGTALHLFRHAATTTPSSAQYTEWEEKSSLPLPGEGVASALVYMGRILDEQGKRADAKEAFRKAALEHDDAAGYYHLAWNGEEYANQTYLTKAAVSGHIRAAYGVGALHHSAARNAREGSASKTAETRMAEEWYHLAATSGEPYSMLRLADLQSSESKWESALSWAKVAEMSQHEDVAKEAKVMREKLEDILEDIKQRGKS